MDGKTMPQKKCKCKVCTALNAEKLNFFCVVYYDGDEHTDQYFLAVGKNKRQFTAALKKTEKILHATKGMTKYECREQFSKIMADLGFVQIDDLGMLATEFVNEQPPPQRGYKITLD
jgi:ssDNA-specific exonuclease RecJ